MYFYLLFQDNEVEYLPLNWICSLLLHILTIDSSDLYRTAKTLLQCFCELLDKYPRKGLQQAEILEPVVRYLLDENDQLRECALMVCLNL